MTTFETPEWLHDTVASNERVRVVVIGAGGTGSEVLSKLFRLDYLVRQLGGEGLDVTIMDDDTVSHSNIGRQAFYPADLGRNKAEVLAERFAQFSDMKVSFSTKRFEASMLGHLQSFSDRGLVVFTCVDNPQTRHDLGLHLTKNRKSYNLLWIDGGNDKNTGQVVLGTCDKSEHNECLRLPSVYDLFKEQLNASLTNFKDTESCSHEASIQKQDFGVNDAVAFQMVQLLWRLLRHGKLSSHGALIDLGSTEVSPIAIDSLNWEMYGYKVA